MKDVFTYALKFSIFFFILQSVSVKNYDHDGIVGSVNIYVHWKSRQPVVIFQDGFQINFDGILIDRIRQKFYKLQNGILVSN